MFALLWEAIRIWAYPSPRSFTFARFALGYVKLSGECILVSNGYNPSSTHGLI